MIEDYSDLARRLFDALESGDAAALKELYVKDAVLWTNTAQREVSLRDLVSVLPLIIRKLSSRTYSNRRVTSFDGGFIHRHRLTGVRSDGAHVAAECCALVSVVDGKVTRIDEYLDGRQQDAMAG